MTAALWDCRYIVGFIVALAIVGCVFDAIWPEDR